MVTQKLSCQLVSSNCIFPARKTSPFSGHIVCVPVNNQATKKLVAKKDSIQYLLARF